jgi:hypothetical protein
MRARVRVRAYVCDISQDQIIRSQFICVSIFKKGGVIILRTEHLCFYTHAFNIVKREVPF